MTTTTDVVLVGGGVMSATLGVILRELDPSLNITLVERLDHVAHESTDGWNNAGTGHAGYCELNYTPEDDQGNISIDRALDINSAFEVSLQLWSYLVSKGELKPEEFIHTTPHCSFVWGEDHVNFLRKRHGLMSAHHLFKEMEFSEDPRVLEEWMPLITDGRDPMEPVAATRVGHGADVDFGSLTRALVRYLESKPNFELLLNNSVTTMDQADDGSWKVSCRDRHTGANRHLEADFVFIGAGGGALPLLQKSGIEESKGYGGFPVSGQWLVCRKPDVVERHDAKVYGKAPVGAPPMSVPHLDTRIINGEPALLFGPFAGFTTKFQKEGSFFDLFSSLRGSNFSSMMGAGMSNMDLTRYLIGEVFQSAEERIESLRNFYPRAKFDDWTLQHAGKRVQVIKKDANGRGVLQFGTEVVAASDGSLAALLGASPGASTAAKAMIDVLERCFPGQMAEDGEWTRRLQEMIPSHGRSLKEDADLLNEVRPYTLSTLKLNE